MVSDNYRRNMNASVSTDVSIFLLTIEHDALSEPIRLASDGPDDLSSGVKGCVSRSNDFIYSSFDYQLPDLSGDTLTPAKIIVGDVDYNISRLLQHVKGPAKILYEEVLHVTPDLVEISVGGMYLRNIQMAGAGISGQLYFPMMEYEPIPSTRIIPAMYPGVF